MGAQITSLALRRIQLDLLIAFDKFCAANDLHYSLDYGTLLGAVRHQRCVEETAGTASTGYGACAPICGPATGPFGSNSA